MDADWGAIVVQTVGSGGFLVIAVKYLAGMLENTQKEIKTQYEARIEDMKSQYDKRIDVLEDHSKRCDEDRIELNKEIRDILKTQRDYRQMEKGGSSA